ncbi:MAG: hypothetical protein QXI19_05625 [Candidatus Caldarchaeum sp.]
MTGIIKINPHLKEKELKIKTLTNKIYVCYIKSKFLEKFISLAGQKDWEVIPGFSVP